MNDAIRLCESATNDQFLSEDRVANFPTLLSVVVVIAED